MVMVMSIDGKITKWNESNISAWTSKEDKEHFFSLVEKSTAIIMGRKTYEAAKSVIKHSPNTIRIVVTSHPKKFSSQKVPGQLEFSNESPNKILEKLSKHKEVLLLGGGHTNTTFLKEGLVNEIKLTVEPFFFGNGERLIADEMLDLKMKLLSATRLNSKGTLLLHYKIL